MRMNNYRDGLLSRSAVFRLGKKNLENLNLRDEDKSRLKIHARTGRCKRHYLRCSAHRTNDD